MHDFGNCSDMTQKKKNLAKEWQGLINPDDLKVAIENFQKHCADPYHPYDQIVRYRHKNGKTIWVRCRGIAIRDEQGKAIRMLGAHNNLTNQMELEESLWQSNVQLTELNSRLEAEIAQKNQYVKIIHESETSFRLSFDYAAIGMGLVSPDGRWLRVNKSLCQMLGMTETELLATTFQQITHPDDLELDLKHVYNLIDGSINNYQMEKRYFHKLGHIIWINLSASLVRDEHNKPVHFVSQIENITERKMRETEITHLAYHDTLTDLPNRRLLLDRLNQAVLRAQREKTMMSVFFLDIDYFKGINDKFGHDIGDIVLSLTAEKINSCIRKTDTLGRQGGDEFVLILNDVKGKSDVISVAENIMESFTKPLQINGQLTTVSLSIGISIYERGSINTTEDLMKKSDMALYEAKTAGRNGFRVYSETSNVS